MKDDRPILIIAPEPGIRAVIRYLFATQGYRVITAGDAVSARRRVADETPGAILLELVLPGESGLSLLRSLKANADTAAIPVFVTTGRVRRGDRELALAAGAADFLARPFDEQAIIQHLDRGGDQAAAA
jgi:DNA-binding response OmpR family regulator